MAVNSPYSPYHYLDSLAVTWGLLNCHSCIATTWVVRFQQQELILQEELYINTNLFNHA